MIDETTKVGEMWLGEAVACGPQLAASWRESIRVRSSVRREQSRVREAEQTSCGFHARCNVDDVGSDSSSRRTVR